MGNKSCTIAVHRGHSPFTGGRIEGDMQVAYPDAATARSMIVAHLGHPLYLIHVREKPFDAIPARYWLRMSEMARG